MVSKILFLFLLLVKLSASAVDDDDFTYNGFSSANMSLGGIATITPSGLLRLTSNAKQQKGLAFYSIPLHFIKKNSSTSKALSFSTSFVIAIVPEDSYFNGHGIAFVISPSKDLPGGLPAQFLGLVNSSNNGDSSNHIFAVELDTSINTEFGDIDDNHVGINVNGLNSINSTHVAYFTDGGYKNLSISSGEPIQVSVDYSSANEQINITIWPINVPKPKIPLLSSKINLSDILLDSMYVGFSSGTGSLVASHYILGWSFAMTEQARALNLSNLPLLPSRGGSKKKSKFLTIGFPPIVVIFVLMIISGLVVIVIRKMKFAEVVEDWEREYLTQRFSYKDLFIATKGFKDKELLGMGGFGRVYKGVLPSSKNQIAVKRVSHESTQGMRQFIAEITSLGRLRHRNLVQLLGYCRRRGELLLVYDFMPNGSLDKFLFGDKSTLDWSQRIHIIKGVASGLLYLHEEWEQVVVHRDVKASNVLIDGELNGRLGDFGLARLYDHGTNPQTTHVVGTLGYLAPELARTGKATTSTDVFAFGAFMLEVACGRRPIDMQASAEEFILVDWVSQFWRRGVILEASDSKLRNGYVVEEMELVLKLGLLCSHPLWSARPSMRQVMQFLDGNADVPELLLHGFNASVLSQMHDEGVSDLIISCTSSDQAFERSPSVTESLLSGGR